MPEAIHDTDVIAEAAKVASAISREDGLRVYTLSTGVRIRVKAVPPLAIREAAISQPPPQIPIQFLESKGREEPNPNDPAYNEALEQYQREQLARSASVMMVMGTEIDYIPDDVVPPESDEWIEMLEAVGVVISEEIRTSKHARRLAWMRLYAIRAPSELSMILAKITGLSGVTELEVQRAAAAFLRTA